MINNGNLAAINTEGGHKCLKFLPITNKMQNTSQINIKKRTILIRNTCYSCCKTDKAGWAGMSEIFIFFSYTNLYSSFIFYFPRIIFQILQSTYKRFFF